MDLPIFVVDAFSDKSFAGNPAAVCLLQDEISDELKQKIAAEMNLSETAFVQPLDTLGSQNKEVAEVFGQNSQFRLRWFTPKTEVPLCGHATLATAAVLFQHCKNTNVELEFFTEVSGCLFVRKIDSEFQMTFPYNYPEEIIPEDDVAIQSIIKCVLPAEISVDEVVLNKNTRKLLVRVNIESQQQLEQMAAPNYSKMTEIDSGDRVRGVIVTGREKQPSNGYDFVSRYFAPWVGIPEDPVTGSAHTVLAPYWANRLQKCDLFAKQCSPRGGELSLKVNSVGAEKKVLISGKASLVLEGKLKLTQD